MLLHASRDIGETAADGEKLHQNPSNSNNEPDGAGENATKSSNQLIELIQVLQKRYEIN